MKLLIDADTIAFSAAATAENEDVGIALARTNQSIENLLACTEVNEYELWLSGANNFRYRIYPEYKVNRLKAHRPKWEKECKQFLIDHWGANVSEGCEADDMVGVRQIEENPYLLDDTVHPKIAKTMIAHIDKDINMIPGWHYNWELTRLGKVVRAARKYFIIRDEAMRNFYYQLLVGDIGTDNIKGVPGIGPKKAQYILDECTTDAEMFSAVRDAYACDEEMEMNAGCLWIWRKMNDIWKITTHGHQGGFGAS